MSAGVQDMKSNPEPDMKQAEPDMKVAEPDMPGTDDPDMKEDATWGATGDCVDQIDCQDGEICAVGKCYATVECSSVKKQSTCRNAFLDGGLPVEVAAAAFCDGAVCQVGCVRDTDCAMGNICSDNGQCRPFEGTFGEDPGGDAREPLQAGVGNVLMKFPMGLPIGGYGSRAGADGGRYAELLKSSHGQMHGLYSRAIVLDNGERQLALVRLPAIFTPGTLHEAVARKLQEKTGKDWRNSLVISSTHTHSGPARYLHLPPASETAIPLGAIGIGDFHQQSFDWIVESTTDSVLAALDDLSPAEMGWEIVEAFDTDDLIASDRWGETPPFDDNRLLLVRLNDLEGNPRAMLVSFGSHGTYNAELYFTGDAPAGVERAIEAKFGQEYDRFVPAMYFNQNGGSMSPRGDRLGHRENHKVEKIGADFVERTWDAMDGMETKRDVDLGGVTLRFPLGATMMGYEPGTWKDLRDRDKNIEWGGLQCSVGGAPQDSDWETAGDETNNLCFSISSVFYNRAPTLFLRSQMTALNLDGLTIVTLPGEPAMELGWQVVRDVAAAHGIDPLDTWTFGYAQDHQLYLTPTNLRGALPPFPGISTPMAPDDYPDMTFSYFQGGYEAASTIWGPKMGDFLVDRAVEATALLFGKPVELAFEQPLPTQYSRIDSEPFVTDTSKAEDVGNVTLQPPAQVKRLSQVEFAFTGGDPSAEMPQSAHVVLERELGDGSFEPVLAANTRPYDNREPLIITRFRYNSETSLPEWVVFWEELKSFPAGRYRFAASGHYFDDARERQPYSVTSDIFEVVPTDTIEIDVTAEANAVRGTISYPAAEALEFAPVAGDIGKIRGTYRMRHPFVPTGAPDPVIADEDLSAANVSVTITTPGGDLIDVYSGPLVSLTTTPQMVAGRDGVPVTNFEVILGAPIDGAYNVEVTVIDNHGNTGATTFMKP